jgi:hypothetical protein
VNGRIIVMQYRDPITKESRVAYLCDEHESEALYVLKQANVGCSATFAPSLASCTACRNEATK